MIAIGFQKTCNNIQELKYILSIWAKNAGVSVKFVDDSNAITIGNALDSTLDCGTAFLNNDLKNLKPNKDGFLLNDHQQPDYLATSYFLINSIQEINIEKRDSLGRFRYIDSFQCENGNAKSNVVQECFDQISQKFQIPLRNMASQFFLTHDIDLVYGAILEDGLNVIKKGQFHLFLKMLFNVAIGKPDWLNIDKIMKIETEYDCKSVFYWIVNKGILNNRERNADYEFKAKKIQQSFNLVESLGFENGIHKSISAETFEQEFNKYGSTPLGNRYHYLKFSIPKGYQDIENSGLQLDASLGFAEEAGFRNNYGLPFNPYNVVERRPFRFVEVPLHIMDRTFYQYKKLSPKQAEVEIFDFFENNRKNAVLSVLWHNNFFTDYKFRGYLDLYKKILAYIKDNKLETVSQREIIQNYSIA